MKITEEVYYPYLYEGIVVSTEDTEDLGRCKILVPYLHGSLSEEVAVSLLPWARPIVVNPVLRNLESSAPDDARRGSVNIPDKGDHVWVFFEGGHKFSPVYIGGVYSKTDNIEIDKDKVSFHIEGKSEIIYHRKDRYYNIRVSDNDIKISEDEIVLTAGRDSNTQIKLTDEKISVKGDMDIEGSLSVSKDLKVSGNTTLQNLVVLGSFIQ